MEVTVAIPPAARLKYLQITGVSHSGTTLLAFLLNAQDHMVSIGEMSPAAHVDPHDFGCSCGEPFLKCGFNLELQSRVRETIPSFDLADFRTRFAPYSNRWIQKALMGSLGSIALEAVRDRSLTSFGPLHTDVMDRVRRVEAVARAAADISGAQVYVDTTKNPRRVAYLRRGDQLDLHVIHVIKDVRQGVSSSMKRNRGTAVETATAWRRGNESAARAAELLPPNRFMTLRYHEFAADPQAAVDQISSFVGVPSSPIPADFFHTEHHIIGNRMRLKGTGGVIRNDDSWQTQLSETDLAQVARVAGSANRRFGFSWPPAAGD